MENLALLLISIHLFYLRTFQIDLGIKHISWLYHIAVMAYFYYDAQDDIMPKPGDTISSGKWERLVGYGSMALPFEILANSFRG